MAVTIKDLSQLNIADVQANQQRLNEQLQEFDPTVQTKRGPLGDYLGYYGAVIETGTQVNIDMLQRSWSLQQVVADPSLADDDTVDGILSNFLLTRNPGTAANGQVTIVVSQLAVVTIANGAQFTINGQTFVTLSSFTARTSSSNVLSATDRLMTQLTDGNYAFVIDVTAQSVGTAGNVSKDTLVTPVAEPSNFVKAYTTNDFTGGTSAQTNAQLVSLLEEGLAAKALSGRTNMNAALRDQAEFSGVLATSIIGAGDEEMIRDAHTIFPLSFGGKIDWYIRAQELPQNVGLTKTATLVQVLDDATGIWQFNLSRDEVPGFYDVPRIILPGSTAAGSYPITSDVRSNDMTGASINNVLPDIETVTEGAYTRYQAAVIQFHDTDTSCVGKTVNVSTQDYAVTVRAMPLLADMQAYASDRHVRNAAGDVLVKAPVPCFLQLSFSIFVHAGDAEIDTGAIATALAATINNYGFSGQLPAGLLQSVVQGFLTSGQFCGAIDMFGKLRRPDGHVQFLRSFDRLVIPHLPSIMTTSRTAVFFLDPADVAIAVETIALPTV